MSRFISICEPVNELFGLFGSSEPMYRVVLPNGVKSEYVYKDRFDAFIMSLLTFSTKKTVSFSDFRNAFNDCTIEEHEKSKCGKVDDSDNYKLPSDTPKIVNGPLFGTFNGSVYDQYVRELADFNIYTTGAEAIKKLISGNKALKVSLANNSFFTAYYPFKSSIGYAHYESNELSFDVAKYCGAKTGSSKKAVSDLVNDCKKIISIIEKSDPTKTIGAMAEFSDMEKATSEPVGVVAIRYVYAPKQSKPLNTIYFYGSY